jgi:uncharacterized protein YkwD
LPRRVVYTKDGILLHILVTTGQGREFVDFMGHGTKDFGGYVRGRHLLVKGAPAEVGKLYDAVREIGYRRFGLRPIAMPPTAVSWVCDFVWDDSKIAIAEEEFADIFASELSGCEIAEARKRSTSPPIERLPPGPVDRRPRCGTCGRPEVGSETFARCSYCSRPFCFGHIEAHEQACSSRPIEPPLSQPPPVARSPSPGPSFHSYRRRHRHVWLYLFPLLFFILAWTIGYSSPSLGPRDIILLSLIDSTVLLAIAYGIAGLGRRGLRSKAFAIILILLLIGVWYADPPQIAALTSSGSPSGFFSTQASYLDGFWPESSTTSSVTTTGTVMPTTSATPTSSTQTSLTATSATPTTSVSVTQLTTSTTPGFQENIADPNFTEGKANVSYPSEYAELAQYALNLINTDRNQNGLQNLTLSSIPSGQQHSDSMAYFGYFSHWDVQGYKPYMRYTLLGGTGYVAENAGLDYCTDSPPDSSLVTPVACTLQTVEDGIANSEYSMMYNDAACCNNGHHDNILNPFHNKVSIGIAWNPSTSALYFTEDFENSYVELQTPIYSNGVVTLTGTLSRTLDLNEIAVSYDPTPQPMTIAQLDATFAYDPGTSIGAVFAPCPAGYICSPTTGDGGVAVYANSWAYSGGDLSVTFSLSDFTQKYGSGVYTLYMFDSQDNLWMSVSIFV